VRPGVLRGARRLAARQRPVRPLLVGMGNATVAAVGFVVSFAWGAVMPWWLNAPLVSVSFGCGFVAGLVAIQRERDRHGV